MTKRLVLVDDLNIKLLISDFSDKESLLISNFSIEYEEEVAKEDREGGSYLELEVKTKYYVEVEGEYYSFKSGLARRVFHVLLESGIGLGQLNIKDSRDKTLPRELGYTIDPRLTEDFTLREDYQTPVVEAILEKRIGIIFVPTRGGKTEILINAVQNYQGNEDNRCKVTILVRKSTLAKNMSDRFEKRGFSSVGKFYDGNKEYYKDVLVCVINSVYNLVAKSEKGLKLRRDDANMHDRLLKTDILIVDEIQDGSAEMFQSVISYMFKTNRPEISVACSGTPYMRELDIHSNIRDMNITQLFGSVIKRVSDEYLIKKNYKARGNVIWMNYEMFPSEFKTRAYYLIYKKFIEENFSRNSLAATCAGHILGNGKSCLILVNRISHGKMVLSLLSKYGHGKRMVFTSAEQTCELSGNKVVPASIADPIKEFNDGRIDLLIGTNILNVGVDFPNCQWLILLAGEGNDNDILNKQRTSRVLCPQINDNNGYIIDFIDRHHSTTMKHSRSRRLLYESANYNQYADPEVLLEFLNRK